MVIFENFSIQQSALSVQPKLVAPPSCVRAMLKAFATLCRLGLGLGDA